MTITMRFLLMFSFLSGNFFLSLSLLAGEEAQPSQVLECSWPVTHVQFHSSKAPFLVASDPMEHFGLWKNFSSQKPIVSQKYGEGKKDLEPINYNDSFQPAQFSPDGERILSVSVWEVKLWETKTGKLLNVLISKDTGRNGEVACAQFSHDGKQILTALKNGILQVWDVATGKPIGKQMRHFHKISSAQFSPYGGLIITANSLGDPWLMRPGLGFVKIWNWERGKILRKPVQKSWPVHFALFSPRGRKFATASLNGLTGIWETFTGNPIRTFNHEGEAKGIQFNPDGSKVLIRAMKEVGENKFEDFAQVWDVETGKPVGKKMKHDERIVTAQFSPGGRRILTAAWDRTAQVWNAETGEPIGKPMIHPEEIASAQWNPNGQQIVTTCQWYVYVWEAPHFR